MTFQARHARGQGCQATLSGHGFRQAARPDCDRHPAGGREQRAAKQRREQCGEESHVDSLGGCGTRTWDPATTNLLKEATVAGVRTVLGR